MLRVATGYANSVQQYTEKSQLEESKRSLYRHVYITTTSTKTDDNTSQAISHSQSIDINNALINGNGDNIDKCKAKNIENLSQLKNVSLNSVLDVLEERYLNQLYYTEASITLIALNPYKNVDYLYSRNLVDLYHRYINENNNLITKNEICDNEFKKYEQDDNLHQIDDDNSQLISYLYKIPLSPHIYKYAALAWKNLFDNFNDYYHQNQSIVVSGESGAGKTRTISYIMYYFAHKTLNDQTNQNAKRVENILLLTNIILESFGNARTLCNDNSSRFGKHIELKFTQDKCLCAAKLSTYLLEKTRVVHQISNERNFHIFHQMLIGASEQQKQQWHLNSDNTIMQKYTSHINEDDLANWQLLQNAFQQMNIENYDEIYKLLAAIIHLNQCTFGLNNNNGNRDHILKASEIDEKSRSHLNAAAELLGFKPLDFETRLLVQEISVAQGKRQSIFLKPCTIEEVKTRKNCLVKLIYSEIFNWLVRNINENLEDNDKTYKQYASINLLDIYGFENVYTNSLEQLCINYANEKLQQIFIDCFLKQTQYDYELENIKWKYINYADNIKLLQTLEYGSDCLFNILNEECRLKRESTPTNLCTKIFNTIKNVDYIKCTNLLNSTNRNRRNSIISTSTTMSSASNANTNANRRSTISSSTTTTSYSLASPSNPPATTSVSSNTNASTFIIRHYAGDVCYTIDNLIEKNKDHIPNDICLYLSKTENSFLINILSNYYQNTNINKKFTVLSKFKQNLDELMQNLKYTNIQYIRCIKTNDKFSSSMFDRLIVLKQLETCGIVSTINIHRLNYTHKIHYKNFLHKYLPILEAIKCDDKALIDNLKRKVMQECAKIDETVSIYSSSYATNDTTSINSTFNSTKSQSTIEKTSQKTSLDVLNEMKTYTKHIIEYCLKENNKEIKEKNDENELYQLGNTRVFYKDELANRLDKQLEIKMAQSALRIQNTWRKYKQEKENSIKQKSLQQQQQQQQPQYLHNSQNSLASSQLSLLNTTNYVDSDDDEDLDTKNNPFSQSVYLFRKMKSVSNTHFSVTSLDEEETLNETIITRASTTTTTTTTTTPTPTNWNAATLSRTNSCLDKKNFERNNKKKLQEFCGLSDCSVDSSTNLYFVNGDLTIISRRQISNDTITSTQSNLTDCL